MKTTPCAAKRLEAVNSLSTNYMMIATSNGNAVIMPSINEAVELADEFSLKVCLLEEKDGTYDKIKVEKQKVDELSRLYDLTRFSVALSD